MPFRTKPSETAPPPCLRFQRRTRNFFVRIPVRFGGGTAWFGSDAARAERLYSEWTETTWRALLASDPFGIRCATDAPNQRPARMASAGTSSRRVREVAELVWSLKDSEGISASGRTNWRTRLKPLLDRFGDKPIGSLAPADFVALKAALGSKSINYQRDVLGFTRAFLAMAWELGEIEKPYRTKLLLASPKRKAPKVKGWSIGQAHEVLTAVCAINPNMARMLYLGYLTLSRPSELMRLVYRNGEAQDWILWVTAKTTAKTGMMRPMILTPTAERVLSAIVPKYNDYLGLRHQVWRVGRRLRQERGDGFVRDLTGKADLSPHALIRHTPYRALCEQGVAYDLRRQLMGRGAESVDRHYHPTEDLAAARQAAEVLSNLIPPSTVGL